MKRLIGILVVVWLSGIALSACSASTPTPAQYVLNADSPKLRVGVDANFPSFVIVDANNAGFVGFDVEVMQAVAARSGLAIEFVSVWRNELTGYIARCQLDVGISAIAITEQLKQQMILEPYYTTSQVIVVKKGNITIKNRQTLAGRTVGTQEQTISAAEVSNVAGAKLIAYESFDDAFQGLIPGYIDSVITDKPRALSYVNIKSNNLKVVGEEFGSVDLGIAICKNRADLAAQINRGIAWATLDGTIKRLARKWLTNTQR